MIDELPDLTSMGEAARQAARRLRRLQTPQKNRCIEALSAALLERKKRIRDASEADAAAARDGDLFHEDGGVVSLAAIEIEQISRALLKLAGQPDPVGRVDSTWIRPNGIKICKTRVPIGVIGVAYQGKPGMTVVCAGLCIKSGNAVMLCSDRRWNQTNQVLAETIAEVLTDSDLPIETVQLFANNDSRLLQTFLRLESFVDLIIPHGDEQFVAGIVRQSHIPVLRCEGGVCHIFVDREADMDMAMAIIENARCNAPEAANAVDKVLVHTDVAGEFLPRLEAWCKSSSITMAASEAAQDILPRVQTARSEDWDTDQQGMHLAVAVVDSLEDAVEHIADHGAGHSEAIITAAKQRANYFAENVDAAAVYINASTRFTDAHHFGMGPQIGVSTSHIHARGPIGVEELTTYKYVINGKGQVRN